MTNEPTCDHPAAQGGRSDRDLDGLGSNGDADEPVLTPGPEPSVIDQQPAVAGTEVFALEMDQALLDRVRGDLDDVDAALRRIDEGTYGRCEACGQPIGAERLTAQPAARYCERHQAVAEGAHQAAPRLGPV